MPTKLRPPLMHDKEAAPRPPLTRNKNLFLGGAMPLDAAVHMELRLHGSYARTWGVELAELEQIHPATQAYTDFLMDVSEDPEVSTRRGHLPIRHPRVWNM